MSVVKDTYRPNDEIRCAVRLLSLSIIASLYCAHPDSREISWKPSTLRFKSQKLADLKIIGIIIGGFLPGVHPVRLDTKPNVTVDNNRSCYNYCHRSLCYAESCSACFFIHHIPTVALWCEEAVSRRDFQLCLGRAVSIEKVADKVVCHCGRSTCDCFRIGIGFSRFTQWAQWWAGGDLGAICRASLDI
jgi:hypothetical protein